MLLLRDVHYVFRDECWTAGVVGHGVETADLHVYFDFFAIPPGVAEESLIGNIMTVHDVRYSERCKEGTWHMPVDCPGADTNGRLNHKKIQD